MCFVMMRESGELIASIEEKETPAELARSASPCMR